MLTKLEKMRAALERKLRQITGAAHLHIDLRIFVNTPVELIREAKAANWLASHYGESQWLTNSPDGQSSGSCILYITPEAYAQYVYGHPQAAYEKEEEIVYDGSIPAA